MNGDSHERERLTQTREPSRGSSISRELGGGHTTGGTADQNRIKRVYWVFFILGAAILLPWNAMITAFPFFLERMEDSSLRRSFASYFSAVYQCSSFVAFAHASSTVATASKPRRIAISHFVLTLTLAALLISTFLESTPIPFFLFSLTVGAIQASSGAYLLTSVVAYGAYFGPLCMQSIMSGQAAVAVVVSSVQLIITLLTMGRKSASSSTSKFHSSANISAREARTAISTSASYFFAISTLGLFISYIFYRRLTRMSLFRRTVAKFEAVHDATASTQYRAIPEEDPTIGIDESTNNEDDEPSEGDLMAMGVSISSLRDQEAGAGTESPRPEANGDVVLRNIEESDPSTEVNFWHVWKVNALYNVAVVYIYVITLAIFPAITSSVRSVNGINPQLFSALHFLIFNCGDWLGRYVCSYPRWQIWSRKRLLALSISRTVFIVLFLSCNVDLSTKSGSDSIASRSLVIIKEFTRGMTRSEQETPFINSDLIFFALLALLAFSNGWLTSLIMMSAPSLEHNKRMKKEWVDVAAVGSSFSLASGLVLGSISNFALLGIMCKCNPFVH
ncbi:hypothetical protein CPB86DRAFT_750237 [Serendipita vermifera]|nr:hypothetical protein CPB86DRAFT_750237 [Serendipita vermifera]